MSFTKKPTPVKWQQSKRSTSLIPEYQRIIWQTKVPSVPHKLLEPPSSGSSTGAKSKFGIYHTPKQFVEAARRAIHPFDQQNEIPDVLKTNLFDLFTKGSSFVIDKRMQSANKIIKLQKELAAEEIRFHRTLPEHVQKHTNPIAKTHGTAMLINLKMLINVRHRNITNHDQNITAASPPVTETPKHHRHRAETSPTQNQGIIHISPKHHNTITTHHRDTPKTSPTHPLKITKTSLAHAENILTHHQRITETSPRYHQIIHETQTKHHQSITKTSLKQN